MKTTTLISKAPCSVSTCYREILLQVSYSNFNIVIGKEFFQNIFPVLSNIYMTPDVHVGYCGLHKTTSPRKHQVNHPASGRGAQIPGLQRPSVVIDCLPDIDLIFAVAGLSIGLLFVYRELISK